MKTIREIASLLKSQANPTFDQWVYKKDNEKKFGATMARRTIHIGLAGALYLCNASLIAFAANQEVEERGVALESSSATSPKNALRDIQLGETEDLLRIAFICEGACPIIRRPDGALILESVDADLMLDLAARSKHASSLTLEALGRASKIKLESTTPFGPVMVRSCQVGDANATCLDFARSEDNIFVSAPNGGNGTYAPRVLAAAPSLAPRDEQVSEPVPSDVASDAAALLVATEETEDTAEDTAEDIASTKSATLAFAPLERFGPPPSTENSNSADVDLDGSEDVDPAIEAIAVAAAEETSEEISAPQTTSQSDGIIAGADNPLETENGQNNDQYLVADSLPALEQPAPLASPDQEQSLLPAGAAERLAPSQVTGVQTASLPTAPLQDLNEVPAFDIPISPPSLKESVKKVSENRSEEQVDNAKTETSQTIVAPTIEANDLQSDYVEELAGAASAPSVVEQEAEPSDGAFDLASQAKEILGVQLDGAKCEEASERLEADAWALDAMVDIGFCKAAEGKVDAADEDFSRLLEYTPDNYQALVGRALISAQKGSRQEALGYFQDALNALPPILESNRIVDAMERL